MECSHDQILLYESGELDHKTTAELETHLSQCEQCRSWLEELNQLHEMFHQLPTVKIPSDPAGRLSRTERPQTRLGGLLRWLAIPVPAWGVACALIICTALVLVGRNETMTTTNITYRYEHGELLSRSESSLLARKLRSDIKSLSASFQTQRVEITTPGNDQFTKRIRSLQSEVKRARKDLVQDKHSFPRKDKRRFI